MVGRLILHMHAQHPVISPPGCILSPIKQMNKLPFKGSVGFLHQRPEEENTANPSSPSYANLVHKVIFLFILNMIFILWCDRWATHIYRFTLRVMNKNISPLVQAKVTQVGRRESWNIMKNNQCTFLLLWSIFLCHFLRKLGLVVERLMHWL